MFVHVKKYVLGTKYACIVTARNNIYRGSCVRLTLSPHTVELRNNESVDQEQFSCFGDNNFQTGRKPIPGNRGKQQSEKRKGREREKKEKRRKTTSYSLFCVQRKSTTSRQ